MTIRDRLDAFTAQFAPSVPRKKAERAPLPPGAAPLLWCILLSGVGVAALIGSTWMLLVFVAGSVGHVDWHSDYRATNDGPASFVWSVSASVHWLVGVGLFLFCAAIAMFNATWLEARHHLAPGLMRNVMTGIGVAVALFMISGAIVVQQKGTDARAQDSAKAVQTARAGVAAIDAEIAAIEQEMARLCAPSLTTWQAQACRSGEVAWADRTAISRAQKGLPRETLGLIERAMADAKAGDRWRTQLTALRKERAVAAVTTVETEVQTVKAEGWMAAFTALLEDVRKPVTATLGELLAMIAFGLAMSAWKTRRAHEDVVSGAINGIWADEGHMIPDMRANEKVAAMPMDGKYQGDVIFDGETGDELRWRQGYVDSNGRAVPGHYARTGKRKPKIKDEPGAVFESDGRVARKGVQEGDERRDLQAVEPGLSGDRGDRLGGDEEPRGGAFTGSDDSGGQNVISEDGDARTEGGETSDGERAVSVLESEDVSTNAFLDSILGPPQDLTEEPPAEDKPLGVTGSDGVMRVAAE